ncbi:COG1361 S-layer family protein [Methanoregula sp.]|uniref:COG1361 S-layer family protein n=1 Tax=Methanoregula sp. TaxID=2052170 RepID=UPI003565FDF2
MLSPGLQRKLLLLCIFCIGIGLCITPCQAGVRYISGGPDLFVSLDSTNQLIPGTTAELPVVIENKGKNTMELYNAYTLQPDYLPSTAKFATIRLVPGDAPIKVKSNPQIVGDIASGSLVPAAFVVEIPQDAKAGKYTMEAIISYQYVPQVEQQTTADIEYYFKDAKTTRPVEVVVRPMVVLAVDSVRSNNLPAGGEGFITFTIRNTGQDTGNRTSVYLMPEGASPVIPYSNGIYVGNLPPGGTVQPRFKVAISDNADPSQNYPVSLYAVYRDYEGNTATSPPVSAGVKFGKKVTFKRTSSPSVINPGKTGIVHVTYKNTGDATVYNAQARISVIDPFSSDDDTAYLGDLKPGQSADALFSVQTTAGATIKTYSVASEIQYTDAANTAFTSDNIPVLIEVQPASGPWVIVMVLLILAILGGAYFWFRNKKAADQK